MPATPSSRAMRVIIDRAAFHRPGSHLEYLHLVESSNVRIQLPDILAEETLRLLTRSRGAELGCTRQAVSEILALRPEPIRPITDISLDELRGTIFPSIHDPEAIPTLQQILHGVPIPQLMREGMLEHDRYRSSKVDLTEVRRRMRNDAVIRSRTGEGGRLHAIIESAKDNPPEFECYWRDRWVGMLAELLGQKILPKRGGPPAEAIGLAAKWAQDLERYPITTRMMRGWVYLFVSSYWTSKRKIDVNDQDDLKYMIYGQFANAVVSPDKKFFPNCHRFLYPNGCPELLTPEGLFARFGAEAA